MEQSSISPVNSENLSFSVLRMEIFSNVQIQSKKKKVTIENFLDLGQVEGRKKKREKGEKREREGEAEIVFLKPSF